MNDAWQKPFAADLKFPAWPAPQPIVHPPKPLRGATKKHPAFDPDSSQFDVDLADIDINDLGKMLNPEENIAGRKKKKDPDQLEPAGERGQESMADLVKP